MNTASPIVLIMAGGTGGHIFPGLAVAAELQASGIGVRWLGAAGGMECEKVPAHNIPIDTVRISGLRGKGLKRWLQMPFTLLRGVLDARRVVKQHRPVCAVSFGGYVAGPGGLAARLRGVPLVVHEQNKVPGMTNRVLARFAGCVFQAFPDSFADKINAQTCGNPVRKSMTELDSPEHRWAHRSGPARVFVTGGSQGARSLNEQVPAALALLATELQPEVCHQSGVNGAENTAASYRDAGIVAEVSPFIDDMAAAYAWADLVICRAGALTVSELASAGCGSVLVPYPFAVDDHQTGNAQFLATAGAAVVVQEADLTPANLAGLIEPILLDREKSLSMAIAARSVAVDDAARVVAQACMQWVPA